MRVKHTAEGLQHEAGPMELLMSVFPPPISGARAAALPVLVSCLYSLLVRGVRSFLRVCACVLVAFIDYSGFIFLSDYSRLYCLYVIFPLIFLLSKILNYVPALLYVLLTLCHYFWC